MLPENEDSPFPFVTALSREVTDDCVVDSQMANEISLFSEQQMHTHALLVDGMSRMLTATGN